MSEPPKEKEANAPGDRPEEALSEKEKPSSLSPKQKPSPSPGPKTTTTNTSSPSSRREYSGLKGGFFNRERKPSSPRPKKLPNTGAPLSPSSSSPSSPAGGNNSETVNTPSNTNEAQKSGGGGVSASEEWKAAPLSPLKSEVLRPMTPISPRNQDVREAIRQWAFLVGIRKRKKQLPLNKYGLPDVSADELEKELPEKRVIDQMRKAFRDLTESRLISGWDDGSGFEYVIDLFSQLLDLICSFVGRRQTEKFRKALDIDVLKQMVHAHVYTPSEFQETLKICVGLLYELESPYQHMLTKKWWESLKYDYATKEEYATAICDSIMHLFRKCDLCKMEVENYYISRISPADRQKQELQAFQKIPLPLSTPWDCTSRENFVAGLVKTVANNPKPLQESEVTSCLALDLTQLHTFQNSLQAVTLFGVISIVLNKILMKIDQESLKEFFDNFTEAYEINAGTTDILFEHLKKYISIDEHSAAKEGCAQIVKCADMSDPLYKVLSDRVVKFLVDETTENKTPLGATPEHLCHANDRALNLKQVTATFIEDHWKVYETVYVPTAKMRIKDDI